MDMANDVYQQQSSDLVQSPFFSIACDESTDVNDVSKLAIFARYIAKNEVKEELLGLIPLHGQTRGEDVYLAVKQHFSERNLDANKLVSITTDGAAAMTGQYKGFVSLMCKDIDHKVLGVHCILHQEALCAKISDNELPGVMLTVTKIVNFIVARPLNHRQFRSLLDEAHSEYGDLLMHSGVRWLSRGKVLQRFASCLSEIRRFLDGKKQTFPEINEPLWLCKFAFLTDICGHLNNLNVNLQGNGQLVGAMYEQVRVFISKLKLFVSNFQANTYVHFPTIPMLCSADICHTMSPLFVQFLNKLILAFEE